MFTKSEMLSQIEKTTTLAQLTKVATFELLKKATLFYLKSQISHSKYNAKKTQIYKKALLAGITIVDKD